MILSDRGIERAINDGDIKIDPPPHPSQYDSSSLNLRVGDDFQRWIVDPKVVGSTHLIDLDSIDLADLTRFTEPLPVVGGFVTIEPDAFVLVRTLEHVTLPAKSKLAARVEGRSKQARLGMTAHITAPTIHSGFAGKITLEIKNFGPFHLRVSPNESRLCQLIFERVETIAHRGGSPGFTDQSTVLGTPRSKTKRKPGR
jgi:dCTP deaminase